MTWTLILIIVATGGPPAIDASMAFVDEASCLSAAEATVRAVKRRVPAIHQVTAECIQTMGRE